MKVRLYFISRGFPLESIDIDCPGFVSCKTEDCVCKTSIVTKTPREFFCMTTEHANSWQGK